MTITIDDTYLMWGIIGGASLVTNLRMIYIDSKGTCFKDSEYYTGLIVWSIASLIPYASLITVLVTFILCHGNKVFNTLKYIRNIPKNARLLQTTLHENKQLKQDNAIFQKMLQSGLDYETAKAYIENDDEYFDREAHKRIKKYSNACDILIE